MRRWKEYYTPSTVDEALRLLGEYNGSARIIAGGTDLILEMEAGHTEAPDVLVDVTKIAGIEEIREEADGDGAWIVLGAGVTHYQVERHLLLQRVGTCLTESCRVVGGPQVRNVATLGGNVAHALPAADGTIGLLALDAQVEVCTLQGGEVTRVWQPLLSIFAGPGRNTLESNQMLSAFRFRPTADREGSAFDRIMRPQGVALPILGLAARVRLDESRQRIEDAIIAIGPAGPIPFRATEAEALLKAAITFNDAVVDAVIAAAQGQARLRTSKHRASQEYRHEMIAVLLRRVLPKAVERARN
ncbi:MAG: FAD binding domain-containing protein [Caldilineaceae bacterium]|nr:FAD binding domain-containing protein [Caldilineaceae bacterium]